MLWRAFMLNSAHQNKAIIKQDMCQFREVLTLMMLFVMSVLLLSKSFVKNKKTSYLASLY
jgi:hypothetical protein